MPYSLLPADSSSPLVTSTKCRLFCASLRVNMAIPPMPRWVGSTDVRIVLNVSGMDRRARSCQAGASTRSPGFDTEWRSAQGTVGVAIAE